MTTRKKENKFSTWFSSVPLKPIVYMWTAAESRKVESTVHDGLKKISGSCYAAQILAMPAGTYVVSCLGSYSS